MREFKPALSQELDYVHMSGKNNKWGNLEVVMTGFEHFIRIGERRDGTAVENLPEPLCWKTLRQIRESNYEYSIPVNLQFYQMRNIYGFIQEQILRSWEKHNPSLYVVVGTVEQPNGSPGVLLESVANTNHILRDTLNLLPGEDCYTNRANNVPHIKPFLDLEKIARAAGDTAVPVTVSRADSGYYLCDYAFYHALYHGPNRALCIRLNCGAGHATETEYAEVVKKCITAALDQLNQQGILLQ